jgi:hypothetical protein
LREIPIKADGGTLPVKTHGRSTPTSSLAMNEVTQSGLARPAHP